MQHAPLPPAMVTAPGARPARRERRMAQSDDVRSPIEAYQRYMVPTEFAPWSAELLDRVTLRPGDDVLDVACGTGVVALGAAKRVGAGGSVTGLDPNPVMLEAARTSPRDGSAPLSWVQGRAEEMPFDDGRFDVVLCQQGVQFFADRLAAVREMRRVLRPDGQVGVSVWRGPEHQSVKGALLLALREMFGPAAAVAYSYGDPHALRQLFTDAGFGDIRVETVQREVHEPSAERMVRMLVIGASAAVPALATLGEAERDGAVAAVTERIAPDIEAVRVPDGIRYTMESNILVASA